MKKGLITFVLLLGITGAQTNTELENVKVLPFTKKKEIIRYMKKVIAPGLGVKCKFCHNLKDYPSDEKEHKVVARTMMKMMIDINTNTMKKLEFHDVTCYVCHRGEEHPAHPPKK